MTKIAFLFHVKVSQNARLTTHEKTLKEVQNVELLCSVCVLMDSCSNREMWSTLSFMVLISVITLCLIFFIFLFSDLCLMFYFVALGKITFILIQHKWWLFYSNLHHIVKNSPLTLRKHIRGIHGHSLRVPCTLCASGGKQTWQKDCHRWS